jgi:hypothetical protein
MSMRLPNWHLILALFCCAGLALAPAVAGARAGLSFGARPSSVGSRGWRSHENNGAQPLRSQPQGASTPAYGGSFQRHPFLTGFAGGIFGSWLFGHGAGGGFGGGLLGLLLLGLAVWFVVRLIRARMFRTGAPGSFGISTPRRRGRDVNLSDAALDAFRQVHAEVQDAWSTADLARLRRLATPEMCRWFAEELNRNAGRGVRNIVADVRFIKGELTESWDEGGQQYASALMCWRARDYVVELAGATGGADFVVGGDPRMPVETEEMWTFVRFGAGPWLLSAIQQI